MQKNIKAKLDMARPNNKDSPSNKRQQDLRAELAQIRTQQQSTKSSRGQVMDKVKRLDENLKSRIAEQKAQRSKIPFKSVEEINKHIDELRKAVDEGKLKVVDERKSLDQISQLNRQKAVFGDFEKTQEGIDQIKAQIAELKKTMDDPAARALSDRLGPARDAFDRWMREPWLKRNVIPIAQLKAWLGLLGLPQGPVRPPLVPLTRDEEAALRSDLDAEGIL